MNKLGQIPDFKTWQERDAYFSDHAAFFTLIKKQGIGHYERSEYPTLAEAQAAGQTKILIGGGNYMIYAVIGSQSAFVKAIK